MSKLSLEQLEFLKKNTVREAAQIEAYDKEFNYNFFFPEYEHEALDIEAIRKKLYTKSAHLLGQRVPILVAVNPEDPWINNIKFRIHGRIIDGKHKYQDSKAIGIRWNVSYVRVKDYDEFVDVWLNADISKSEEIANLQLKQRIEDYCELLWLTKPESINDSKGEPQMHNIGKVVVRKFKDQRSKGNIYKYIPSQYINIRLSERGKTNVSKRFKKSLSKKDVKINQITAERDSLIEENSRLKLSSKPETEKDEIIHYMEGKHKHLMLRLNNIRSSLKTYRQKMKIDKTDDDFEKWWESQG